MSEAGKKRIIVADDEEGIRDVFSMIIESNFDHEILLCDCAASAIETIKKNPKIDLIFSDYNMGKDTGGDLYKFLKDKNLDIPFALCSTYSPEDIDGFEEFDTDHPLNAYFQKPFTSEEIVGHINKVCGEETIPTSEIQTFVRVNPERFMRLNQIKETFDVYIRLSKKKYVKIINEGESESFEVIDKYIKKGVDYIFLEWQKYEIFEKKSIEALFDKFEEQLATASNEELTENVLDSIEAIQGMVKNLGVNERTVELIDKVVDSTEKMISKSGSLDELLNLLKSKDGYIKDHGYLCSYVACSIAERMSWKTEGIWKKIITASLFQNISLEENELAMIYDLNSNEYKGLEERVQTKVKMHPQDSVKMISDAESNFSEDTRKMIQNHHELPDGSGFPRGLNSTNVAPLEALFILATNFAHSLIMTKDVDQINIIAQDYNEKYNKGNYKKPYQGFLKTFIKLTPPKD